MSVEIANEPSVAGSEMSPLSIALSRLRGWFYRNISRRVPRLVWLGDEIDVRVHFKEIGALGGDLGLVFEAQRLFRAMGISFDTGSGCGGRDWEWDWSLSGPISIHFRSRAKRPELRVQEPPRPELNIVA